MKHLSRFLGLVLLLSIGTLLLGCTDIHQKPLVMMAADLQPSSPMGGLLRVVEPHSFEEPGIFPAAMLVDLQPSPDLKSAGESLRLVEPQLLTESGEPPTAMTIDLKPLPESRKAKEPKMLVEPLN